MQGEEHDIYFQRLIERLSLAAKVPFREVQLDGWEAKMNDCHGNVDFWVQHHPETKPVRGWLFWSANEAGQYLFMAHSVLEESGQLTDITPLDRNTPRDGLLFLKHEGTEQDFSAMKTRCSQVLYPPLAFDDWRESQSLEVGDVDLLDW
jgi:hypothetical protein